MPLKQLLLIGDRLTQRLSPEDVTHYVRGRGQVVVLGSEPDLHWIFGEQAAQVYQLLDFVPAHGNVESSMFDDVREVLSRAVRTRPLAELVARFSCGGVSLWRPDARQELGFLGLLRWRYALCSLLAQGGWDRILVADGLSWDIQEIAQQVVNERGLALPVETVRSPVQSRQQLSWKGRLIEASGYTFLRDWRAMRPEGSGAFPPSLIAQLRGCVLVLGRLGQYGIYRSTVEPVMRSLQKRYPVVLLDVQTVAGEAWSTDGHVAAVDWRGLLTPMRRAIAVLRQRGLLRALASAERDPRLRGLRLQGIRLWPVLRRLFMGAITRTVPWLMALQTLYARTRPVGILASPDTGPLASCALALAQQHALPSLYLQPSCISDTPRHGALVADRAALVDGYTRGIYLRQGVEPERLVVTGLTRWDAMVERARGADPRQVRQGLHIPQSDALVVFATQPLARETTECMLRPVVRAVGKLARASLVVKVHPIEDTAGYEALVEQMVPRAGNVAVTRDINLGALLVACDVVLTGFSNVAIEAALLNKPVLAINLVGEPDVLPFVDDGIAVGAHTEAEVEQQVASLLTDAAAVETLARTRNAYFERNPYLRDGKATERVVALVEEMVGAGRLHSEGG